MKRRNFLKSLLSVIPITLVPSIVLSDDKKLNIKPIISNGNVIIISTPSGENPIFERYKETFDKRIMNNTQKPSVTFEKYDNFREMKTSYENNVSKLHIMDVYYKQNKTYLLTMNEKSHIDYVIINEYCYDEIFNKIKPIF